jgi:hypothetical protein
MTDRVQLAFDSMPTAQELRASLKANGVCMVRNYLGPQEVAGLKDAVKQLAYAEHRAQLKEGESHLGRYSLKDVAGQGITSVGKIIADGAIRELADDFFAPYQAEFRKIYCHHDVKHMEFNNAWHFDRGLTLKFFFYLNDVKKENGAFWYDPGSHLSNGVKQYLWWQAGTPILNYVPASEVRTPMPMEGPAGTLIIFDAAGYHQAGSITDGGERWVIRYHVHSGPRLDAGVPATNPYGRRNWDYRSQCFSEREDERDDPWGLTINGSAKRGNGEDEDGPVLEAATVASTAPVLGRVKRLFSKSA